MSNSKISVLNYFFIIAFFFLIISRSNAQKSRVELLQLIQQKDLSLDKKGDYLCELSTYYKKIDTLKAYAYANQALKIAEQLNVKAKQAIAYESISDVARFLDNVPKQIKFADSSFLLATQSNDEEAMAYANYAIAYKYETIGDQEKYIYYMLKSLSYFEKHKIRYDKLVNGYENLGSVFSGKNDIKVYEKYTKKALQLSYESKKPIIIANALTSWALFLVSSAEHKTPVDVKLLHSAELDFLKAIKIFESDKNKENVNLSYGRTYLNLTFLYLYHFFDTQKTKTIAYLKKTEEVCLKLNNPMQLMVMYGQQAQFYTNINDISNVEKVLKKIEVYINKNKNLNPKYFGLLYKNYMDLAELKNDFPAYRNYFKLYDKAIEAMVDKENKTKEYNASIRFETEKKLQEIKLLTENQIGRAHV